MSKESILKDLNPPQREAVEHTEGPLLVFAGAGSGKTRALTYRITYLVSCLGIDPGNILAVTFTNKAAKEMKERIEHMLGTHMTGRMWVGTFHATCSRILRERGDYIGLSRDFVIYDTDDQNRVVRACLEELGLDERENNAQKILNSISRAKEQLVLPDDYRTVFSGSFDPIVDRVYPLYQQKLAENRALDFDDLILYAVRLLEERPEVRGHYQDKFNYILVDEYQDINFSQFQFIRLLGEKHKNICCVGDDDQSIYSWRGADVSIILAFRKHYPNARIIKLEQNYRSTRNILDAAYHVISKNDNRAQKQLWTDRAEGETISLIEAADEHEEAVSIVSRIRDDADGGKRGYSDFVILYRTNAQSRVFEEALMNYRVPYKIIGGVRFYERKEIKDLMAYLRVVFNPCDSIGLKRILNVPARGVGPITIDRLEEFAKDQGIGLFDALSRMDEIGIQKKPMNALAELGALLTFLHNKREELSVAEMVTEIIESVGFVADLKRQGTREADSRVENIMELLSVIEEFERTSEDKSLRSFLEQVALVTDIDSYEEDEQAVTLMTLHAAKGLEFPVVFMAGMEEGIFPHSRSMMSSSELEEERRLCYVGMTRAKDELYLCHARSRAYFGSFSRQGMSRFIRDIPPEMFGVSIKKKAEPVEPRVRKVFGPPKPIPPRELAIKPGDRVSHRTFGIGVVEEVAATGRDHQVTVLFDDVGRKKLMASFAGLQKV